MSLLHFQLASTHQAQWTVHRLSIIIIYNSKWSIFIQWTRVMIVRRQFDLEKQKKAFFLLLINLITWTKEKYRKGRTFKFCETVHSACEMSLLDTHSAVCQLVSVWASSAAWPATHLMRSKMSGLLRSRSFIRSLMALMMLWVLSSAPCFELFSAAPVSPWQRSENRSQSWYRGEWLLRSSPSRLHQVVTDVIAIYCHILVVIITRVTNKC